ncbi:MAG: DUF1284 domain-containing protein [Thermoplasmata archaeon]|nr:DUF1284 domain-containing protein [Thermoplasmata archaeon]
MKLRGHHLICLQFFKGKGYSKDFVNNAKKWVEFWESNSAEIVKNADDICSLCPFLKNGRCNHPGYKVDEIDELALTLLGLKTGDRVRKDFVKKYFPKIFKEWREKACKKCEWKKICLPQMDNIT